MKAGKEASEMNDCDIVELYFERSEHAIDETAKKYGRYLTKIAYNILYDELDSEESVNDTYLAAWNSIPPHKPSVLSAFLSKLTRRISIDKLRMKGRKKRGASEYVLSLDELSDIVSDSSPEKEIDTKQLAACISDFLRTQPIETRAAFVSRYYYLDSTKEAAKMLGMSEGKLKSLLHRTRRALRDHLAKEGFIDE